MDTSAYEFKSIPDLTDEQKKDPYSKFYYMPVNRPDDMDENFISCMGVSTYTQLCDQEEEPYYILVFNCVKETDEGAKIRYMAYSGVKVEDGVPVKAHEADPDRVRLFAMHNAYEFQREGDLLPKIYEFSKSLNRK